MVAPFQKDSVGWQWQQLTQRLNEWIEARWTEPSPSSPDINLPQWSIPEWFVKGFFWGVWGALLAWCLWKSFPTLKRLWYSWLPQALSRSSQPRSSVPQHSLSYWLRQSKTLARQSNYPEACRALYFALLQWFHEQGIILHSSSRTDGEYVHLLSQVLLTPPQAHAAAIVLHLHQQLCFSPSPLDQQDFLHCQQAIETLKLGA